jgi:hypothetical protein
MVKLAPIRGGLALLAFAATLSAQIPPPMPIPDQDAQRTRAELGELLRRYPPSAREVLQLDAGLFENQSWLATYPALAAFLKMHPEIGRNPAFFVGTPEIRGRDRPSSIDVWRDTIQGFQVLMGMALFMGLVAWFIRTLVDSRRWNIQNKVQTDAHMKLLERLSGNEELMSYIQSPAGAKFLESSPIRIDAVSRGPATPMGRIIWTLQAGVVLTAAGIGLFIVARQLANEAVAPLRGLGILGIALGIGFVTSAILSFLISRRLGILDVPARAEN